MSLALISLTLQLSVTFLESSHAGRRFAFGPLQPGLVLLELLDLLAVSFLLLPGRMELLLNHPALLWAGTADGALDLGLIWVEKSRYVEAQLLLELFVLDA